ncbi:MAG: hypothetical protein KIT36_01610 [Alphaproteobacteria bacterium]|nr:hypothetical protein [Alphaproteobacteria bacterium]
MALVEAACAFCGERTTALGDAVAFFGGVDFGAVLAAGRRQRHRRLGHPLRDEGHADGTRQQRRCNLCRRHEIFASVQGGVAELQLICTNQGLDGKRNFTSIDECSFLMQISGFAA